MPFGLNSSIGLMRMCEHPSANRDYPLTLRLTSPIAAVTERCPVFMR